MLFILVTSCKKNVNSTWCSPVALMWHCFLWTWMMENLQQYSSSLFPCCFAGLAGCLWMTRVTWFGSEVCPGPARRRRLLVFSLVRIIEMIPTAQNTKWNKFHHYTLFPDCDIIGKVNGVCFTYSKEGRPSGEAFIELKTAEDFKNALAKDRKYMGHRYIEGKIAATLD